MRDRPIIDDRSPSRDERHPSTASRDRRNASVHTIERLKSYAQMHVRAIFHKYRTSRH